MNQLEVTKALRKLIFPLRSSDLELINCIYKIGYEIIGREEVGEKEMQNKDKEEPKSKFMEEGEKMFCGIEPPTMNDLYTFILLVDKHKADKEG